jgi:hypothetical protein
LRGWQCLGEPNAPAFQTVKRFYLVAAVNGIRRNVVQQDEMEIAI